MNKNEFTNELRELSQCMTKEQIEKAIMTLSGCRNAIYKRMSQDKEDMSRLLVTIDRNETELDFIRDGSPVSSEPEKVKVLGASLLTREDFDLYGSNIPDVVFLWWLYDQTLAWGNRIANTYSQK